MPRWLVWFSIMLGIVICPSHSQPLGSTQDALRAGSQAPFSASSVVDMTSDAGLSKQGQAIAQAPDRTILTLPSEPASALHGRLWDGTTDTPIGDAHVFVMHLDGETILGHTRTLSRPGPDDGRWEIARLPASGEVDVVAFHPKWKMNMAGARIALKGQRQRCHLETNVIMADPVPASGGLLGLLLSIGREANTAIRGQKTVDLADGLLSRLPERQASQYADPYPVAPQVTRGARSATAFVMDVSGSMNQTWSDGRKIDSAKKALRTVTRLIRHEIQTLNVPHFCAIVTFTTDAEVRLGLTGHLAQAELVIDAMEPEEQTNLGAGLQLGFGEIEKSPVIPDRLCVLLSDGMTNEGLTRAKIMAGPVAQCSAEKIPIYVCGYGDPSDTSSMDADFLKEIAENTGGSYYHASSGAELEDIYIQIRHESLGEIIADATGIVTQGETKEETPLQVAANTEDLHITLNWPGSWLDLIAFDPRGTRVTSGYPGDSTHAATRPAHLIVHRPKPGEWKITIHGRDVPEGRIQYHLLASIRKRVGGPGGGGVIIPPPQPLSKTRPGGLLFWVIAVWILCVLVGGTAVLTVLRRRAERVRVPVAYLVAKTRAGEQVIPILKDTILLGRSMGCDVRLIDPMVSGTHATLTRTSVGFTLTDHGSANGTVLNGQRLAGPTPIRSGDVVRMGNTELQFVSISPKAS